MGQEAWPNSRLLPLVSKVEEAMTSAEINTELVYPLRTPNFALGTHDYDPKRHDLIEGVSKCIISRQKAQAKFNEYHEVQGSHDEVYSDGSKMNERVGAAAVINRHFQNGETTCRQQPARQQQHLCSWGYSHQSGFELYQHMGPVHHDEVVYSDSMSCLQAIEGEDTENPLTCHIMNLLWLLSDRGTHIRFCWIPSHCGIEGNERVDQLAKETLDQEINPLASVHYTDLKPFEAIGYLLHSEVGSNQVEFGCTWQRSLLRETNTGPTNEIPVPDQGWRGCNYATSNWPYQGHQVPYLVPRTTDCL